jgi:ABC-type proline/glycine betaine transport system ATPase subunit
LRLYQAMMDTDRVARVQNQRRLRELKRRHGETVDVFCSHDLREFERAAHRTAQVPAAVPAAFGLPGYHELAS